MTRWNNSYEVVMRCALETSGAVVLPVDEGMQATPTGRKIKNFDLMVWRSEGAHWLLEIKGRKLGRSATPNAWVTMEDVASLEGWKTHFGCGFEPMLGFVFELGMHGGHNIESTFDNNRGDDVELDLDSEFEASASPWHGAAQSVEHHGPIERSIEMGTVLSRTAVLPGSVTRNVTAAAVDMRLPHFVMHGRAWQAWLVTLSDFQAHAKLRSARWKTLMLSVSSFRRVARPLLAVV